MSEWQLNYSKAVVEKDIPKLDKPLAKQIRQMIETKLKTDPIRFGKSLRYSLKGHRSLRVSDYRVLYLIDDVSKQVYITAINHRRDVYTKEPDLTSK